MTELHVVTNWHKRPKIYWHELTKNEREQFDYIKEDELEWFSGFRYRGSVYDLGEFEIAPDIIKREGFDGWQTQSYFDGIAVMYFDREGYEYDDAVIVAHIHW